MTFFLDNNTKTIWKFLKIESMELSLDKIPRKGNILVCGVCEGKRTLPGKDKTIWNYSTLHNYSYKHTIVCPNCVCLVGPDNINMDDSQLITIDINEICVNEYSTLEYDNIYEYRGIDPNSVSFRPVISYLEDDGVIYAIKDETHPDDYPDDYPDESEEEYIYSQDSHSDSIS